ncbi:MAG: MBL fold metallo-hydrolase [Hungatella sp.]|jgi:L-ascorbate metabolism protein UlaG (beta-lactamase superfamily)|nr:MBL fold metallo-hydrolase [Hungatella sp.]
MKDLLMQAESVSFRWINCQCFEIKLPNGKTIVTDPCYDYKKNPDAPLADLFRLEGFKTEDLEGCDYVILNHTHGDHIANLGQVIERFSPKVICHSGVAGEIAQVYQDMELTSIYPVDYDGAYYFDGFKMETFHGEHKPQRFTWRRTMAEGDIISQDSRLTRLHALGGLFNMNYLLTLDNGFRIAFVGGASDGMEERLRTLRPNIALRNKISNDMDVEHVAEDWLEFMEQSCAQFVVPMHFEVWENQNPGFSEKTFKLANEMAVKGGLACRILSPKRTKWYRVNMNIECR